MTAPRRFQRRTRGRFTPLSAALGDAALVSSVTHEFTQPLATVTSLADLLATEWGELSDDVRRDLADRIDAGARGLATRYRHMVVVMDILGGRVAPGNSVTVRPAIAAAAASMPYRIGVAGPAITAAMDRDHLEHVVATLLADAIAPLRVRVVPTANTVTIKIADHGPDAVRATVARTLAPGGWKRLGNPASRALGLAVAARLVATDGGVLTSCPMRVRRGAWIAVHLARSPS
ncbi:MAG TPA: hypothetical protein VGF84_18385 [Micromonosporaceae bacterium]|jgi:K+-sensing histidine kinase KdpD